MSAIGSVKENNIHRFLASIKEKISLGGRE